MLDQLLYRRKRRDRWWRFLELKEAFIDDASSGTGAVVKPRSLQKAFRRFGYPLPPDLCMFWSALVSLSSQRSPRLSAGDLEVIETQAERLESAMLPTMAWLDLFRLGIGAGVFETARILREKALDRMILEAGEPGAQLGQVSLGCYAEIERGRYSQAQILLERMGSLQCPQHRLLQAKWYSSLMAGKSQDIDATAPWASPKDPEFGKTIRDRRVALVGPVASEAGQGSEIDQHDVVVKFGYRGGSHGRDPNAQGERIDIAYYNNTQAQTLARDDFGSAFSELRWGVCHNRKGASHFPDALSNLRLLTSLQWFMPDTHLNAGPNAVLDMLRFRPTTIRIFNTDMMLSSGRFAGYRQANDKPTDYTRSFIKTHDPILQYQIMRRLWSCGYVQGDVRFEEVMAMGLRNYLVELQKAYGADSKALF